MRSVTIFSIDTQRPFGLIRRNQPRLDTRALFISLKFQKPSPPKCLGLHGLSQEERQKVAFYFGLSPTKICKPYNSVYRIPRYERSQYHEYTKEKTIR